MHNRDGERIEATAGHFSTVALVERCRQCFVEVQAWVRLDQVLSRYFSLVFSLAFSDFVTG
jgi:hypothetical protein